MTDTRSTPASDGQFLRMDEPRECPACWGRGHKYDRLGDEIPCSVCAETGKVIPFVAKSESERTRWIPISERLPSKGDWIVIRWNDDTVKHICERYEALEYYKYDENGVDWKCATHWMPIPKEPA